VRDPQNVYSVNACQIQTNGNLQIGFVPEEHATHVAPLLDGGSRYCAYVTKVLTGGRSPIPVVQLELYGPDATLPDLRRANRVIAVGRAKPSRTEAPADQQIISQPASRIVGIVIALAILIWLLRLVA